MEASKGTALRQCPPLRRGGDALAFGEELGDLALGHRLGEQEALALVAAFELGGVELLLGLDALDDGGDAKAAGEPDHRADDSLAILAHQHLADEGAVDLDLVEREIAQICERRIAGAEV